jgi:hypothetical protein
MDAQEQVRPAVIGEIMRKNPAAVALGKIRTEKKAAACRINGTKGPAGCRMGNPVLRHGKAAIAALRRVVEIIDSGDIVLADSHYGSELASWRALLASIDGK